MAVCEAVGIEAVRQDFAILHPSLARHRWKRKFVAQKIRDLDYKGCGIVGVPVFPRVSTEAGEALKVATLIDPGYWRIERFAIPGGFEFAYIRREGTWTNCKDFCHAICIAALRTKGREVIL